MIFGCAAQKAALTSKADEPVSCKGPCVISTAKGATMPVPELFEAKRIGNVVELIEPDNVVKVFMVEIESGSCETAIKAAWKAASPGETWSVERRMSPPSAKGYDEILVETYVQKPDRVVAQAVARRKGGLVWVSLLHGPAPAVDKRSAQVTTFISGLKAPGVKETDLAAISPRSINLSREDLSSFIREAMKLTGTPGLEIAVVENGKVVLADGFGVRELGKSEPVTPDTLMMIGSVTKSMTTLMMATLVDEGRLSWTRRVRDVVPGFGLADPKLSDVLTMEQLVCACAGLPRKDVPLVLSFEGKGCDDVLKELSRMSPSTGLRETFQYQNHMVAAGGFVSGHAFSPGLQIGQAYDAAMSERVFKPLGMASTTLDFDTAVKAENHATPHSVDLEGAHRAVPMERERFTVYIRPSGGVWSNVRDMSRYVITELQNGVTPEGVRIVSEANLLYRRQPQVKINADASYGLGWVVARTKGLQVIEHGGGTMGFATNLTFYPEKGLGVVMIANGSGGHMAEDAILSRLLELWFGHDEHSGDRLRNDVGEMKKSLSELKPRLKQPPAEWIAPYLGTHFNAEIGELSITKSPDGRYLMKVGGYETGLLRHEGQKDRQALMFTAPPLAGFELFLLDGKEGTLELVRAQERYVFQRREKR
jgi:CubicO group peptidase (beta-lactamase class C family)